MNIEMGLFLLGIGIFIGHIITYERLKRLWKPTSLDGNRK